MKVIFVVQRHFVYFWLCWVFFAACGLSLAVASRGYFLVAVGRLLIAGFSCFGVWAPGLAGFSICGYQALELWHRLSCSMACRIFLDQGSSSHLLRWQADSSPLSHQRSPDSNINGKNNNNQCICQVLLYMLSTSHFI